MKKETNKKVNNELDATKKEILNKFGEGSIMTLGDVGTKYESGVIPTGALSLDIALGVGGVPRGRIIEIYGPESSGKTTMALQIVAEAQRLDGVAAYIDAEHALDPIYASNIGVDVDKLLISQPDTGEQGLEICNMLVKSGSVDVIIIDSVAALVPKAEISGEMGDVSVGLHARLMSQALRKLTGNLSKSNTTCIFINQLREKIGIMFGNPETTTGGRALKFFSTIRLDIRRSEWIKKNNQHIGSRVKVKVAKNKVAPPFRIAEFDIMFGTGVSKEGCILDLAVQNNIVKRSGSWYVYKNDKLGCGREAAKETIKSNSKLKEDLEQKIKIASGLIKNNEDSRNAVDDKNKSELSNTTTKKLSKNETK